MFSRMFSPSLLEVLSKSLAGLTKERGRGWGRGGRALGGLRDPQGPGEQPPCPTASLSPGGALGKLLGHTGAGRARWLGHILVNLSSCVALNRFQPLPSVTVLEATAHELLQQNSFLASKCSGTKCRGGRVWRYHLRRRFTVQSRGTRGRFPIGVML